MCCLSPFSLLFKNLFVAGMRRSNNNKHRQHATRYQPHDQHMIVYFLLNPKPHKLEGLLPSTTMYKGPTMLENLDPGIIFRISQHLAFKEVYALSIVSFTLSSILLILF